MRKSAFFAIALAGLALSACAPRYYYDDRYGYDGRYYGRPAPAYDRGRYDDRYYDWRNRY